MRTTLCTLAACGALLVGSATPALAAAHDPQRPAGPVVSVVPSDNGGDRALIHI